jgi:lysophospholipase L1-like esterase
MSADRLHAPSKGGMMKWLSSVRMAGFIGLFLFFCLWEAQAFYSPAYTIMPLGNSITRGYGQSDASGMFFNGYRKPLYEVFRQEGYDIDFVGLQRDGRFEDPDHESYGGRTADDLGSNVYAWLASNPADIVLLHIGTNDITSHQPPSEIVAEVATILDEIDRYHNEVMVLVAQIINLVEEEGSELYRANTSQLNLLLADMIQSRINDGDKLSLVNLESSLDYSPGSPDFYDMRHPSEVGYQKMADTWYWPLKDILDQTNLPPLEAGEVAADHTWSQLNFERSYVDPVVVVTPMGTGDSDPAVVRVRNVTATGCEIRVQAWDYLADDHGPEQIGYLVMEKGMYALADGTMIAAGHVDTNACLDFEEVLFAQTLAQPPVVVACVESCNESDAVSLRIDAIATWGFTCKMQEQERNEQIHATERISYIAWEPSIGSLRDIAFEVRRVDQLVPNTAVSLVFSSTFASTPVCVGAFQSFHGSDPCTLRWDQRSASSISLYAQEETSIDSELSHKAEDVGYVALISKESDIDADRDGIPDSEERTVYGTDPSRMDTDDDGIADGAELAYWGDLWNQDFDQDGLIQLLDPDSDNDGDTDGFEINNGYDPLDPTSVSQGTTLPVLEAAVISVNSDWKRVDFNQSFNDPIVVAGPLGLAQDEPATLRIRNVESTGFEIKVQEWGYQDNLHLAETASYLVMERGKYTLEGGVRICADKFTTLASGARQQVDYLQVFSEPPVILSAVTTVNESEAVIGRIDEVSYYGFEYGLREEEQSDQTHAPETISYIAWEPSSGILSGMAFEVGRTGRVVNDILYPLPFVSSFAGQPGCVADMQTLIGTDPCNVRFLNITGAGIDVLIDEEESLDAETTHYPESIGYLAFSADPRDVDQDGDGIPNDQEKIYGTDPAYPDSDNDGLLDGDELAYWGEAWNQDIDGDGLVNLCDPDADGDGDLDGYEIENGYDPGDPLSCSPNQSALILAMGEVLVGTQWERVDFGKRFSHPIVVAGPIGFAEIDPAMVRIRNVNATGCEMAVREWAFQDGVHAREEVGFFVMEQGKYTLKDGTRICAGMVSTNGGGLLHFAFNQQFNTLPLVFTSVITENDAIPVVGRLGEITTSGFNYLLQEEEEGDQIHASETVAYIAWEAFSGTVSDTTFSVVRHPSLVTHEFQSMTFDQDFTAPPVFLADMQTFYGDNTANLRFRNKTTTGVDIKIEEEQSLDAEVDHVGEEVGYMVFPRYLVDDDLDRDGLGNEDEATIYGTNATRADTDGDGINDGEEVAFFKDAWNQDPDNDGLTNLLDPDSDNDGFLDGYERLHGYDPLDAQSFPPDQHTLVFESREIQVGSGWKRIDFQKSYREPVVVAGPMGLNDVQPATLCIRNVNATGFDIRIREWTYQDDDHAEESLTYMAMEYGEYVLEDGVHVRAGYKEIQGGEPVSVPFGEPFDEAPVIIASVMTDRETDPAVIRIIEIGLQSFTCLLQEEEQGDQVHGVERIGYVAWEPYCGIVDDTAVEVGRSPMTMDHYLREVVFLRSLAAAPDVLADMQTYHGANTCNLRLGNRNTQMMEVMVKEEQSLDVEMEHVVPEVVGFVVCSRHADDVDLDRDGIDNYRETIVYGTLPDDDDSDKDGLKDGQELAYWGDRWNEDIDGDKVINLLDPDADNDGDHDGYEVLMGTDPADPLSVSPSSDEILFQVGEIEIHDHWQHLDFTEGFTNPVFVAGPMGSTNARPATIRVRNLNATGCDVRIQPWNYQNTDHGSETAGYLVMESGKYVLGDGTLLCAENIEVSQGTKQSFFFKQSFNRIPRVFASVVSENDPSAVVGRIDDLTVNGFTYALQEEEDGDQIHGSETVSCIAWEDFSGIVNGHRFAIGLVEPPITHEMQACSLGDGFFMPPVLLADMQDTVGGNPANVRHDHNDATTVQLAIVEEQSRDLELDHYGEPVAFMACTHVSIQVDLDGDGLTNTQETDLYGTDPGNPDSDDDGLNDMEELTYWGDAWSQDLDGDGLINILDPDADGDGDPDGLEIRDGYDPGDSLSTEPSVTNMVFETGVMVIDSSLSHLDFKAGYSSPVVVFGPLGHGDNEPATIRISNVTSSGCDVRVQEWACQDGNHGQETAGYMVMEKGDYVLNDGTLVQAGLADMDAGSGSRDVFFASVCNHPPVLFASVTTENDPSPCVIRLSGISNQGFTCTLQEEEAADQIHGSESVGYIAWEPASGVVNRKRFKVDRTGLVVTSYGWDLVFDQDYSLNQGFVADMQTFNGDNPSTIRCDLLTGTMASIHIDEEQSLDSEVKHYEEIVGYAVFSDR